MHLLLTALWSALAWAGSRSAAVSAHHAPSPDPDRVRIVFLGDSGNVPDREPCAWRPDGSAAEDCHITVSEQARLKRAVRALAPDAVYGLGDLVYPNARGCSRSEGDTQALFAATVGQLYADLDAPAWLVLGNHDVGHLRSRDRRVRCLEDFAATVDELHLPSAQYSVDHGVVTVVVLNTNLRDQSDWASAAARAAQDSGDWVVLAGHHELRTAWEKEGEGAFEPPAPGQWLVAEGLRPDLWANGHAHTLQLGTFDARTVDDAVVDERDPPEPWPVLSLTSGGASKLRANPTCAPSRPGVSADDTAACAAPHPRGMPDFALARFGFAVVDFTPAAMEVRLFDLDGVELTRATRTR